MKRDTEASNKMAQTMKAMKIQKEREDDEAIVRYNREKDQAEFIR